jgi:dipeptidyl aminopeptidase B
MAALIGIFAAFSYKGTSYQVHGSEHLTMDHIFNGTFAPMSNSVRWIPEGVPHSAHKFKYKLMH